MGGIGISLSVDARAVAAAKRDVDALNHSLKQTEELEGFELGKGDLDESSRRLKQILEDVRRLKGLARSGEKQGGLLNVNEFKEAAILSRRIRSEWQGFSGDLAKARQEMGALIREKARLEKVGRDGRYESPDALARRYARIDEITAEIEARGKGYSSLRQMQGKLGGLANEGVGYTNQISDFGRVMPDWEKGLKRAFQMGAGVVAGFSVFSYLSQSVNAAAAYEPALADLRQRAPGFTPTTSHGFTLSESLEIAATLSKSTGLRGGGLRELSESVKTFSRGLGLSEHGVTGFIGAMVPSAGGNGKELLQGLFQFAKKFGRPEDFLSSTAALFGQSSQGQGGMDLSKEQQNRLLAMQASLWNFSGQMGKGLSGAQLLGQVDAGIRSGGGSRGQSLFLMAALGGRMNSVSDYWDYQKTLEAGLSGKGTFKRLMGLAAERYGTEGGELSTLGKLAIKNTFQLSTGQTNLLWKLHSSGSYNEAEVDRILKNGGPMANAALASGGTEGGKTRAAVAEYSAGQISLGKELLPWANQFREAVDMFVKGVRNGSLTQSFEAISRSGPGGVLAAGSLLGWPGAAAAGAAQLLPKFDPLQPYSERSTGELNRLKDKGESAMPFTPAWSERVLANMELQDRPQAGRSTPPEQEKKVDVVVHIEAAEWLKRMLHFKTQDDLVYVPQVDR